jgi:hypothetical protein
MRYVFSVRQHDSECGLRILGRKHGDSEPVLAELRARAAEVEDAFGSKLDWVPGEHSRIRASISGGYIDKDKWPELVPHLTETMRRLVSALEPAVSTLKSRPATTGGGGEEEDEEEGSP